MATKEFITPDASGSPDVREIADALHLDFALEKKFKRFNEYLKKCTDGTHVLFPHLGKPGPDDWLRNHPTPPEPFLTWQTKLSRNDVTSTRNTIYILPLGEFLSQGSHSATAKPKDGGCSGMTFLSDLEVYTKLFFASMNVKLLTEVPLAKLKCSTRNHTVSEGVKRPQLHVPGIFTFMKNMIPEDAYCVLGVTMVDLYPKESWNFVFGRAMLQDRIGVFSFARHHPNFFNGAKSIEVSTLHELTPDEYQLLQWRAIKVLTHEIGHMFGLQHCVYFSCLMNGSNNAEEGDRAFSFLCPVCLRKLQFAIQFKFLARYKSLMKFFQERSVSGSKFAECAQWIEKAIAIA
ncbi:archaemetzincin-2-like [Dysidea avara]|uniref:archaemetzincin-2-like n=1 Tax=Dysidea avara TaxID=196820 RepID=UPI00331CB146